MTLRRRLGAAVYGHPAYVAVRKHAATRTALDFAPQRVTLPDGSRRTVTRHIARLIRWENTHPGLKAEAREARDAYEGGDVLDIGAFHGWYSMLLAPKASKGDTFVSLEPNPSAHSVLLANLGFILELFPQITAYALPHAMGNGSPMSVSFPQGHAGHPQVASGANDEVGVPTITVDRLVHSLNLRPTFIKIDVEGAESFVLDGMQGTIASHRPTVMLETHPKWQPKGMTVESVRSMLICHGYTSCDLDVTEVAVRQLWTPSPARRQND